MTANALLADRGDDRARVVGHVDLDGQVGSGGSGRKTGGDFLDEQAASPWSGARLQRDQERVLAEIAELQAENRWDDIIALFHPVQDKLPELEDSGMAGEVRLKVGFALGRAGRHAEALDCLLPLTRQDPDNAMAHYSMAYTAMDTLFSARSNRQPMPHREKKRLLETAHDHFSQACRLRPDSVTFFYRHGVLYKEIEQKPRPAIPLFEQAIANWEVKDTETAKRHHQQRPKYIKAMYHLSSCLLGQGMAGRSLELMKKVIAEDQDRDHMAPVFKHFAMGKILYTLGRPEQALEHLELAAYRADKGQPVDFVHELAARCGLVLQQPERAAKYIDRIPAPRRRPYVRWTEADVLVALGRKNQALQVLTATAERDRRSRHQALIRIGRIHLGSGNFTEAEQKCRQAVEFCRTTFGNPSHEAMFWQAAALYKLGRFREAGAILDELADHRFRYPNFNRLTGLVRQACRTGKENKNLSLVQKTG